jgi:hypothetical protein
MYSTREALAYTGKLPEQQNQAAITPQLLDLLALQKVEADKKAAAQQLALTSGQAQPTVAQGLQQRAMQSARQEITQKLGLAGLAQAQPPAGPMPQQAPQQGLAGAQSNLPDTYQGGGIIAFAQGGSGGDAHGRFRQDDEQAAQSYQNDDRPPEMAPENTERINRQWAATEKLRDQDPEAEQQRAMEFQQKMLGPNRDAAIARKREQQAGLKALYERQVAERPSNLQVALDRMAQNIHQRGGFGAAMLGVSPAVQAAREGYTKQEIAQLNTLSAIDDEIDKAIENNDVSKYNAGVARKKEIEGQIEKGVQTGATMSDVLERVLQGKQTNYERIQEKKRAQLAEDTRKRELAEAEDRRIRELAKDRVMQLQIARAGAGDRASEAAQLRRDALAQKARTDAINYAEKLPNFAYLPPEQQEETIQRYTRMILAQDKAPAAPTINPDRAAQFKVMR